MEGTRGGVDAPQIRISTDNVKRRFTNYTCTDTNSASGICAYNAGGQTCLY